MYELIILSFLMRSPMHGYQFLKIINDMIGPFAKLSNGRFYPLLTKLEGAGLIAAVEEDGEVRRKGRRQRTFRITDAGRGRFRRLMMDTSSNPGEYQKIFWHKVAALDLLDPDERLYLIDHYLTYCRAHVFHLKGEMEDYEQEPAVRKIRSPEEIETTLRVMRHSLDQWELEIEHAKRLREREAIRARESADNGAATTQKERSGV